MLLRRVRPSPPGNIGFVRPVFVGVVPAPYLFVLEFLHGMAADALKLRHTSDRIHGQTEAINFVLDGQFQRRINVALLLVAADVQVLMVCAAVRQPVDEPRVSVEIENDRFIDGEQSVKIPVRHAVRMF